MAATPRDAEQAFYVFVTSYSDKYLKAAETLTKDREALLAFYDLPAAHWQSIRTKNPIEWTFATVCLRTAETRGSVTRDTVLRQQDAGSLDGLPFGMGGEEGVHEPCHLVPPGER